MEEKSDRLKLYGQWGIYIALALLWGYCIAALTAVFIERSCMVPPRLAIVKKTVVEKEKRKTIDEYLVSLKSLFPAPSLATPPSGAPGTGTAGQPKVEGPMSLVATIIGEGSALAVINVAKNDEVVSTGQMLGAYKVKEIQRNKVILVDGTQQVVLKMKFGEPEEVSPTPQPSQEVKTDPGVIRKEIGRREFETMINPPDRVAREIGFAPVSRDGKPYGIQLTFVKAGSFLQTIGFQPGDILSSINNKGLYTPEDGMMAYQMMKNEDTVDFKVDRGGRFIQLQIVFK